MAKIDIAALKALATAAMKDPDHCLDEDAFFASYCTAKNAFDEACTPAKILALLARLKLAEAVGDTGVALLDFMRGTYFGGSDDKHVAYESSYGNLNTAYKFALAAYRAAKEGGENG